MVKLILRKQPCLFEYIASLEFNKRRHSLNLTHLNDQDYLINNVLEMNHCWVWQRTLDRQGYGTTSSRKYRRAHRFSWYIFNGEIPEGLLVWHTCDYPPCVNPDHLFLGTHKDNSVDMVNKGRQCKTGNKIHVSRNIETIKSIAEKIRRDFELGFK